MATKGQMPKVNRRPLAGVNTHRELKYRESNAAAHVHTVVKLANDAV